MNSNPEIAVGYLLWGGEGWEARTKRFIDSYKKHPAGIDHALHVLIKGFKNEDEERAAFEMFEDYTYSICRMEEKHLGNGAYIQWARMVKERAHHPDIIFPMNSYSEILADDWLLKMYRAFCIWIQNGPALVGATGSWELPPFPNDSSFPNCHIRGTSYMIELRTFLELTQYLEITTKDQEYAFESGPNSLTKEIINLHGAIAVVDTNGEMLPPRAWPISSIFRSNEQKRLIIGDKQTQLYDKANEAEKIRLQKITWGES